ncbi:MAG: preprotein translocase subunit SecY [Candidatus Komeilibacteria bacterium CG11_big_fil_rev_8_21_14_0_20_36_20]|uniref:Protein translocase subunit SecY n=1 Tax=Candidatus Komeilibacteria bacterium CG11_big_fil_rev_8_21_14_0_20_36_20 TaxID=1974477 RepID=A0A2H0NG14_9BACT|nr:MAG: preprotein translocase subunit SecY [Candidatus Komeilibacteria bacterium CG11_big_fil_rev_8_21_14_0_20_36_20]PIR81387.1 MAG: preprotein translocase subunit SecY [Candidatus Komeilibacteria bacterium CG10_big_fil_rev_8_21_14_0_10_36_65]PJC55112.1 MAG: preprotein translocase subunit SecY [Candidatus Komeilibacteria bacterium CG_4_9_14_0_2_um_filter_36_13]
MISDKLKQLWKAKDIRKNILFVLALLVVFRIAAHVPIPGVNVGDLKEFFQGNQVLGFLNLFSGGAMENFSVVMLGVGPYITASIIFQLLVMIVPKLEALSKEGDYGQQKINQYTRLLTIPLATVQTYSFIKLLSNQTQGRLLADITGFQLLSTIIIVTAGTIFLMWLGELISEKHIGNGVSLIIFAGIVAGLPQSIRNTLVAFDSTMVLSLVIFILIALVTIVTIVFITEGQRNIPISYARHMVGQKSVGGVNTHLPLRVNQAGVIPIIFAISVIIIPPMIAQFFLHSDVSWIAASSQWIIDFFQNRRFYAIFYFLMVVIFTYFYTAVIFHPQQIAENLQKQGGFIPGIRPGRHTADYLNTVMNRIILTGALFLGLIAVLPLVVGPLTGLATMTIGGTSLLIVVAVVIETVKQIDAQLVMRDYEGF